MTDAPLTPFQLDVLQRAADMLALPLPLLPEVVDLQLRAAQALAEQHASAAGEVA
jgi:hypothetical protein